MSNKTYSYCGQNSAGTHKKDQIWLIWDKPQSIFKIQAEGKNRASSKWLNFLWSKIEEENRQ